MNKMNKINLEKIRNAVLEKVDFKPMKIDLNVMDSCLSQRFPDYPFGLILSSNKLRIWAIEIAKIVYLEMLKGEKMNK